MCEGLTPNLSYRSFSSSNNFWSLNQVVTNTTVISKFLVEQRKHTIQFKNISVSS